MLIDAGENKDPLRKRSVRLNLRAALIAYNYERENPIFNFSKMVCHALIKVYGPEYETKRGLPKNILKLFSSLREAGEPRSRASRVA